MPFKTKRMRGNFPQYKKTGHENEGSLKTNAGMREKEKAE